MILVPIKIMAQAKQRLAEVLTPEERFALAQAMCEDVLQALALWQGRPAVAVVTRDSFARDLAHHFNFEVVTDDNSGETSAIEMATAVCKDRGAASTLVVPADIPLIDGAELQKIVDNAPPGGAVLVPDAAGRGTNAAWRSPCDLFPLRFGNDSFRPHFAAAGATGHAQYWCSSFRGLRGISIVPKTSANWPPRSGRTAIPRNRVRSWKLGSRNQFEGRQEKDCREEHGVQHR